jgi:hypothetical protein
MEENDRKLLTEFLGECWHENPGKPISTYAADVFTCVKCGEYFNRLNSGRTFTTWQDMGDVKEKLVEGEWAKFWHYAEEKFMEEPIDEEELIYRETEDSFVTDFANWLIQPTRFCQLAVDFLKGVCDEM